MAETETTKDKSTRQTSPEVWAAIDSPTGQVYQKPDGNKVVFFSARLWRSTPEARQQKLVDEASAHGHTVVIPRSTKEIGHIKTRFQNAETAAEIYKIAADRLSGATIEISRHPKSVAYLQSSAAVLEVILRETKQGNLTTTKAVADVIDTESANRNSNFSKEDLIRGASYLVDLINYQHYAELVRITNMENPPSVIILPEFLPRISTPPNVTIEPPGAMIAGRIIPNAFSPRDELPHTFLKEVALSRRQLHEKLEKLDYPKRKKDWKDKYKINVDSQIKQIKQLRETSDFDKTVSSGIDGIVDLLGAGGGLLSAGTISAIIWATETVAERWHIWHTEQTRSRDLNRILSIVEKIAIIEFMKGNTGIPTSILTQIDQARRNIKKTLNPLSIEVPPPSVEVTLKTATNIVKSIGDAGVSLEKWHALNDRMSIIKDAVAAKVLTWDFVINELIDFIPFVSAISRAENRYKPLFNETERLIKMFK